MTHRRDGDVMTPTQRNRLLPWLHYPVVITTVFALYAWLQTMGASLLVSTYVPVVVGAVAVALLELRFPYRQDWRPPQQEVRTDLVFLTIIQLAWPPLVSLLFVHLLIEPVRALGLPITNIWPHNWPVWVQAVLMVLTVDFLRYWLHRFSHENDTLWRLHSVHHSVEQLYWLNTGRFHPIEKTLQMCLDSLPFLLMGVDERVLALYYMAYSSNGFFQHCNIDVRYGVLNYIVGSAETHRWHHSRTPKESNANYGNTVIVWDLLFGTWFLPKDREIAELGLQEADYPKSFLGLMGAPFKH
jgi:sterol desaturase/sphingolipid hydroxylase (fatty acid hydroxylase superfamily)